MTWFLISVIGAIVVAVVGVLVVGTARRNRRLLAWAKNVPISPVQAEAMRALWRLPYRETAELGSSRFAD